MRSRLDSHTTTTERINIVAKIMLELMFTYNPGHNIWHKVKKSSKI